MAVPAEPEPAVAGYAIPFRITKTPTEFTDDWIKVSGDPAGVQTLPTADVQSAGEPVPGATLCRSKTMVPLGVLKVAKLLMTSGPGALRPGRFLIAPLESPVKEPVFGLPGVSGLAGVLLTFALKKIPVALIAILPDTVAEPVTDWAVAGVVTIKIPKKIKVRIE